jgi:hypothetical protein
MKTHPLNVSYLVTGLVFLGIAGSWALHQTGVIGSTDVEWLLPLTLVVAGGIGLVAFVVRGTLRRPHRELPGSGPFYEPVDRTDDTLFLDDRPDQQGDFR